MDQTVRFWEGVAEKYSRRPIADEPAYEKKLQVTREYFRSDMEVLELGCGTGSTALLHAPFVKHIRAVDISPKMLEIARARAEAQNVKTIDFVRSAIEAFGAPNQTFDAVLALSVLHLLEDKEAALAKIYKMLKPGGIFVSSTACIGDMAAAFKYLLPVMRLLRQAPLVKVFTAGDLEKSMIDAGFHIDHKWTPGKGKAVFIVAKKCQSAILDT